MREFAERLIAYETRGNNSSETKPLAAFLVDEKLRRHLATLMGSLGFRALLSRALVLANAEVPWLRAVHVKTDGSLEGCQIASKCDPFSRPRMTPRTEPRPASRSPHSGAEPVLASREWRAGGYARFLKRQLSLPVSMMSQWWVSRSSMAVVIFASPNTCGQSAKARLVVISSEVFS